MHACAAFQHQIGACAINEDAADQHKAVFPRSELEAPCTHDAICAVLHCACATCHEQRSLQSSTPPVHTLATSILGQCLITFSLLGYIGCPQLIPYFVHLGDTSIGQRLEELVPHYIRTCIWKEFDDQDKTRSSHFAKRFSWFRHQFFLPFIDGQSFADFSKSTKLPFIEEQSLLARNEDGDLVPQHGGFGRVFSFRILPEYDHLSPDPNSNTLYVRKELFSTSSAAFHAERSNLELVKELHDPHLVRLVKAYKHGETFNFIFLRSMTNLGAYLRDSYYAAPSLQDTNIQTSPLWDQAFGIAKALSHVINYTPPNESKPLYGYHLDLKPANILVEPNGTFLISDFGLARFQPVGDTSRITPFGGSEAYAPPEIDLTNARYNRKYDIWSLGCIILEILTYIVKGHDGVKLLDKARLTRQGNIAEDRFWEYNNTKECYQLKPTVSRWVEDLRNPTHAMTWQSREFLHEISDLILNMLHPLKLERLSSQQVCQRLDGILNRFHVDSAAPLSGQVAVGEDEVEYAAHVTRRIQSMLYNTTGTWVPGSLTIVEDAHQDVHVLSATQDDRAAVRMKVGPRSQTKLVPRYASHSRLHEGYADCHLYFSIMKSGTPEFPFTRLYFREESDRLLGLSAFIGQDIMSSLPIQDCNIERKRHRVRRDTNTPIEAAITVELWSENAHLHPPLRSSRGHRRSVRRNLFSEPTRRRVVIYFPTNILTIRFAKNVRLERLESASSSKHIKLIPTDRKRDPTFSVSMLKPSKGEQVPGIPMSSTFLEKEEDSTKFECKSVELAFNHEHSRNAFYNTYRKMKEEWRIEDKEYEQCRRAMHNTLGFSLE
ncbi:kinase-like protein [Polyplosphaeria fusca]|uniref:non-specific serine/threonine protein kinase n=1 Tax=Polyplosphaeria fusca TaxID=682080 RepID=A0A9P4R4W0_9PLEO|nr:kinase-like protein [Polyplosphaeria fusca]